MHKIYDVAIIGGGPAGRTAACLLARAGRRVVVLERQKFPRFHIGESLLPRRMPAFEVIRFPQPRFQLPAAVHATLAGNINAGFSVWGRMPLFHLVVFLQKFATLCPRLTRKPFSTLTTPSAVCAR